MSEDLPTSVWSGSFKIGDVEIKCHILSNGQRIIEADSIEALLGFEGPIDASDMSEFAEWMRKP